MKKVFFILGCLFLLNSCKEGKKAATLSEGIWRAELIVQDQEKLAFNFKLFKTENGNFEMETYNAEEVIPVDEIEIKGDSIWVNFLVYEGYLAGKFTENKITGDFIKESLDRIVPFEATFGKLDRFDVQNPATVNISGIWEVLFEPNTENVYMAKGIFTQSGNKVFGTFRTTTGDYRYLDGVMDGNELKVSAFDGAHAFLFTATTTDSTLNGAFYSGNHSKESFVGKRNEAFELPSTDSLTFLNEGYDKFTFSFPNAEGETISLEDEKFKDKVVLVQIMGTWCPNCLDETKYYLDYLKKNPKTDLEIVALAFEYAKTEAGAFKSINRLKDRIGVEYPILLVQYGTSDKEKAQEKLPMLNHVLSYPTSIFIDRRGKVRKIHTGFNGPATGDKYLEFQKEFDQFVKDLLAE